jgi:hypothetical protein
MLVNFVLSQFEFKLPPPKQSNKPKEAIVIKKYIYFFLVGCCACHLRNPATKCDLSIG